jgi:hypothetical protein
MTDISQTITEDMPKVDLPDLRRRILADEQVSIEELRQAIYQLRANRTAPPEKKQSTGRSRGKTVQTYALDDLLDG